MKKLFCWEASSEDWPYTADTRSGIIWAENIHAAREAVIQSQRKYVGPVHLTGVNVGVCQVPEEHTGVFQFGCENWTFLPSDEDATPKQ